MMNSTEEETVVASLRERDADLAQKIIDEMFVFDNLLDVEDRAIQLILAKSTTTRSRSRSRAPRKSCALFLRNSVQPRRRDAARGPGSARPDPYVRRGRAEEDPADRPPPGRERPDRAGQPETTRMSDADTGSTTQLAQRRLAALADAVVRRAAARRGRARAGTRSRRTPEVVLAQLRAEPWPRAARKVTRKATPPAMRPAAPKGREAGFAEGREAGYAEGLAWPANRGADEAARLHAMAESCAASIGALEERMGQSLLTLALDIAQQVIRNTLAEQPEPSCTPCAKCCTSIPAPAARCGCGPIRRTSNSSACTWPTN